MAWRLFSACLAPILLLIKVPSSSTYKSHIYTSQLQQHSAQHSYYIYTRTFLLFLYFTPVSLRGLLGPNPSVGHIYEIIYTGTRAWGFYCIAELYLLVQVALVTRI
jgi:hypothetical protein